jgi:hypothetical protein
VVTADALLADVGSRGKDEYDTVAVRLRERVAALESG